MEEKEGGGKWKEGGEKEGRGEREQRRFKSHEAVESKISKMTTSYVLVENYNYEASMGLSRLQKEQ